MAAADDTERWLPIPGYEGLYDVSDKGRVRSVGRTSINSSGQVRHLKPRLRKPSNNGHGYLAISLHSSPGNENRRYVHDLVLTAFVGERPDGMQARHIDGSRDCNFLSNLEWGTPSANAFDKQRHGTDHYASRTTCSRGHELTPDNIRIRWRSETKDGTRRVRERVCLICERQQGERRTLRRKEASQPKAPRTECRKGHDITGENGKPRTKKFRRKDGSIGESETIVCVECEREHSRQVEKRRKAARRARR